LQIRKKNFSSSHSTPAFYDQNRTLVVISYHNHIVLIIVVLKRQNRRIWDRSSQYAVFPAVVQTTTTIKTSIASWHSIYLSVECNQNVESKKFSKN